MLYDKGIMLKLSKEVTIRTVGFLILEHTRVAVQSLCHVEVGYGSDLVEQLCSVTPKMERLIIVQCKEKHTQGEG